VFGAFKLLVLIHDGETKSYLARHPSFDRAIMLHVLPDPGSAESVALAGYLDRLSPAGAKLLLDRGEENGARYLVTERLIDFRNLREWLEKVSAPAPADEPLSPTAAAPPGEFTRLFSAPSKPAAEPVEPITPAEPGSQTRKPGAFTRAFMALSDTNAPPDSPPAETVPPPPASSKPGEFTRFFQSPMPQAPVQQDPVQPVPTLPAQSSRPAFQQAGEFTRMFGQMGTPAAAPASAETAKPAPADDFSRMFAAQPAAPPEAPPAPVAPPLVPALPSTPVPPTLPTAPALAAPTSAPASSNLPIIGILVLLAVAALALIAYFALKR
jgi:hypothetical protein